MPPLENKLRRGARHLLISEMTSTPTKSRMGRMFGCTWRQKSKNIACPMKPDLHGKRAIVTGGAAGVGEQVSFGLLQRGAEVTVLCRGASRGKLGLDGVKQLTMDLSEAGSVVKAISCLGDKPYDLLICNAGVALDPIERNSKGFDKTFATNVLGHHLLYRLLIEKNMLSPQARIVLTSGEAYVYAQECSVKILAESTVKGYASSKLGNLWQCKELCKRYPNISSYAVHPGVIASGLGGRGNALSSFVRKMLLLNEEQGAQASLVAATQDLPSGSYWHNTMGVLTLAESDPVNDQGRSKQLWEELEHLCQPYLNQVVNNVESNQ